MDFLTQAEKLREEVKRRIAAKEITQSALAKSMNISQGVLSAFLKDADGMTDKKKKDFSRKRWNDLLLAMRLTVEQLLDPPHPSRPPESRLIPMVSQKTAIEVGLIPAGLVLRQTGITYLTAESDAVRDPEVRLGWDRFVAIKATRYHANFMRPRIEEGCTLLLDRFIQKLEPSPSTSRTIYAISDRDFLKIGYLDTISGQLFLLSAGNSSLPIPVTVGARRDRPHIVGTVTTILHHLKRAAPGS